jgi:hypothetical protein
VLRRCASRAARNLTATQLNDHDQSMRPSPPGGLAATACPDPSRTPRSMTTSPPPYRHETPSRAGPRCRSPTAIHQSSLHAPRRSRTGATPQSARQDGTCDRPWRRPQPPGRPARRVPRRSQSSRPGLRARERHGDRQSRSSCPRSQPRGRATPSTRSSRPTSRLLVPARGTASQQCCGRGEALTRCATKCNSPACVVGLGAVMVAHHRAMQPSRARQDRRCVAKQRCASAGPRCLEAAIVAVLLPPLPMRVPAGT